MVHQTVLKQAALKSFFFFFHDNAELSGMLEGQGQEWNAGASTSHKEHVELHHIP